MYYAEELNFQMYGENTAIYRVRYNILMAECIVEEEHDAHEVQICSSYIPASRKQ